MFFCVVRFPLGPTCSHFLQQTGPKSLQTGSGLRAALEDILQQACNWFT